MTDQPQIREAAALAQTAADLALEVEALRGSLRTQNDLALDRLERAAAAERSLSAMRGALEALLDSMVTDHDACALCLRDLSNHASGCPVVVARSALSSSPVSTEALGCLCSRATGRPNPLLAHHTPDHCGAAFVGPDGMVQCSVCWAPAPLAAPPENKEDHHG